MHSMRVFTYMLHTHTPDSGYPLVPQTPFYIAHYPPRRHSIVGCLADPHKRPWHASTPIYIHVCVCIWLCVVYIYYGCMYIYIYIYIWINIHIYRYIYIMAVYVPVHTYTVHIYNYIYTYIDAYGGCDVNVQ